MSIDYPPPPPTILKRLVPGTLTHERRLLSSVTTSWGVDWDEEMIARDLMQNFFDANHGSVSQVTVRVEGSEVVVAAPTQYNLERLYYLGSEKGMNDVGQYGEGFKAAAVSLLRDRPHALLAAASADQLLWIHVDDNPVEATQMRPLIYDFFRGSETIQGNRLFVCGASSRLSQALERGLSHFLYPGNPLLGVELASEGNTFRVYWSTTADGHIFYRNLRRGDLPGVPLVLVMNKEYQRIEKKIANDRDRKAFGEELRQLFYNHFARYFFDRWDRQRLVVEAARSIWETGVGHPLLAEIAGRNWRNPWAEKIATEVFGNRFFANSSTTNAGEMLRFEGIEQGWRREGRLGLPGYFARFGVINAERHCRELELNARREAREKEHRPASSAELTCIDLLRECVVELAPDLIRFFDRRRTAYSVAKTEVLLGELRQARGYRSYDVFLAEDLFEGDFAGALSVFLHEHAHIFGYDGSRVFTDELTRLLENVVRLRASLDRYEQKWTRAQQAIHHERRSARSSAQTVDQNLESLPAEELRRLLNSLPPGQLRMLLRSRQGLENEETG